MCYLFLFAVIKPVILTLSNSTFYFFNCAFFLCAFFLCASYSYLYLLSSLAFYSSSRLFYKDNLSYFFWSTWIITFFYGTTSFFTGTGIIYGLGASWVILLTYTFLGGIISTIFSSFISITCVLTTSSFFRFFYCLIGTTGITGTLGFFFTGSGFLVGLFGFSSTVFPLFSENGGNYYMSLGSVSDSYLFQMLSYLRGFCMLGFILIFFSSFVVLLFLMLNRYLFFSISALLLNTSEYLASSSIS